MIYLEPYTICIVNFLACKWITFYILVFCRKFEKSCLFWKLNLTFLLLVCLVSVFYVAFVELFVQKWLLVCYKILPGEIMMTFRRNEVIQNLKHRLRDMTADWCSIKTQEFVVKSILHILFTKLPSFTKNLWYLSLRSSWLIIL